MAQKHSHFILPYIWILNFFHPLGVSPFLPSYFPSFLPSFLFAGDNNMSLPNPQNYPVVQQFRLLLSRSVMSNSLQPMDCILPDSSVHGDSPGKNTGVGCHRFLQGVFPTQVSNPGLPHCRQILYCLSHPGSPIH